MKSLQQFLNESLNESAQDNLLKKLQSKWNRRNKRFPMDMSEMVEFAKQALKAAKVKAADVQVELDAYEDPDDISAAMEEGEFMYLDKFLDEFANILADTDKYGGKEGDYADAVIADPNFLFDLMEYIDSFEK